MEDFISVQICDDHELVRAGLRRLLDAEPGLVVICEASSVHEAVAQARASQPDVLLLDIAMPRRAGLDTLLEIAEVAPKTQVLVLSMNDDATSVRQAFRAGAAGYLLMEAAETELVHAIREVANGRQYLHPLLGARFAVAEADPLSDREHEVLHLLALGHTNQEIAKLLFISVRTAETHRGRIMQKLGLRTRAEIVRYALAAGELDGERNAKTLRTVSSRRLQPQKVPSSITAPTGTKPPKERREQHAETPRLAAVRRLPRGGLSGERLA